MTDSPKGPNSRRWVSGLLLGSLALNLLLAGIFFGGMLFGPPLKLGGPAGPGVGISPRVLVAALGPEEGRRVMRELRRDIPDLRNRFGELRSNHRSVVEAIRAEPYDASALSEALGRVRQSHGEMAQAFQDPFAEVLSELTPEQRARVADAFERMGGRRPSGPEAFSRN